MYLVSKLLLTIPGGIMLS